MHQGWWDELSYGTSESRARVGKTHAGEWLAQKATQSAPTLILFLVHVWLTLEPGGEKGQTTPMNSTAANPLQEQLRLEWTVQTNIRWLPGKMCFQCRYSEIPLSNDNVTNATPDWGINSLDLPWISGGGVARLENGVTNHKWVLRLVPMESTSHSRLAPKHEAWLAGLPRTGLTSQCQA